MKKLAATVPAASMVLSLFTACGAEKKEGTTETNKASLHTLYFRDSSKSTEVTATFFNSVSGKSEDVKMTKLVPRSAILLCFRIMICPLRITCRLHEGSVFDTIREDNTDRIILYKVR